MTAPPKWAQDLTLKALLWWESKGNVVTVVPELVWRRGSKFCSSGNTRFDNSRITVTAGRSRLDQKLVLLHEIAHSILPTETVGVKKSWSNYRGIKHLSHTDLFWDTAWELYRWAKLPVRYCLKREKNYRAGASVAYRRNRRTKWLRR